MTAAAPAAPSRAAAAGAGVAPVIAGVVVFVASGAVLVLEIIAGRLLAPYVGVTLETYTAIIGVVLAGIAVGTRVGGAFADRIDPRRLLGPLVATGGALALATLPVVRLFGVVGQGGGAGAVLLLSLLAFFAPAAVLSAVTPAMVKLRLADLSATGSVVGRLSGLATAGSIAGTLLTGFLLVSAAPSDTLVLALGAGLLAGGAGLWWWLSRHDRRAMGWVVVAAGVGAGLTVVVPAPCDTETAYYCATVAADPDREGGRVLLLDNLRHSYVDLDDPTHLEFTYTQALGDVVDVMAPPGEPLDALHIGGGGFTMPRYLAETRPGSTSLVLEIDPGVVELAREELGLVTGPDLEVRVGDARLALDDIPDDSFDLVVGDAFGGLAVPWHLTTREFVAEIHGVLRPGGTYAVNLIDNPPLRFARAEIATLADVFAHVAVIAPPGLLAGEAGGNLVAVASDDPIDGAALARRARARGGAVATGAEVERLVGDAPVLTDDYAPVDQWLEPSPR